MMFKVVCSRLIKILLRKAIFRLLDEKQHKSRIIVAKKS